MPAEQRPRRVLIIVENLPVPFDRRVWQEATTLRNHGYAVSVICPRGLDYTRGHEVIDGIEVFRHPLPVEADHWLGYLVEYALSTLFQFLLAWRVFVGRGFDVIHACNPPDSIFLVGLWFRLFGKRFIFDHHDLSPELYEAKTGRRGGVVYRTLLCLERWTYRCADVAIAPNESFRRIAIERDGFDQDRVFIVRSGPDLALVRRRSPNVALKRGRRYLVTYVGIMGAQDGVPLLLEAAHHLVHREGREDVQFLLVGGGTELEGLRVRTRELGLSGYLTFTGLVPPHSDLLADALSTADVGVTPDPPNAMNDQSTMNKTLEYMAYGKPVVQFDLTEGRASAGAASLYAGHGDPVRLAAQIATLLDDEALRNRMGRIGRLRIEDTFAWEHQVPALLAAYDAAFARRAAPVREPAGSRASHATVLLVEDGMPGGVRRAADYLLGAWHGSATAPAVERIALRGAGSLPASALVYASALARIARALLGRRARLVHVNMTQRGSTWRALPVVAMARLARTPVVLHLHSSEYRRFVGGLPRPARSAVRWLFRSADRVIVLGDSWAEYVRTTLGADEARLTVLHNAVPGPAAPPVEHEPAAAPRLLFLGRLGERKGVRELLAALARPEVARLPWQATLAGDGEVERYRHEAARLGLADRVTFTGWIAPDAVARELDAADLLVLPSYAEGLPLAILEALAHGLAVIATPVGATAEVIRDGESGLLVPPGDVLALAAALRRVIADPQFRARLGAAGREAWERDYDLTVYASRMRDIYDEVAPLPAA